MNKFKLLFIPSLLIVGLLIFNSCTKDLNEKTFSSITQETNTFSEDDFESAIGPVYSNMRGLNGFYNYFVQEITTDEMVQPANASGWDDGGRYKRMHQHTWTALQAHVNSLWGTLYQGVIHANRIIAGLENGTIQVPSDITKKAAVSEMRAVRAFYYWLILDNFGDAPLVTKRSGSSTTLPSKTKREDIYKFVVDELKASIPNLSEKADKSMYGRFNKWTAKTVLAAVYLNAEVYTGNAQWDKVITQTNDVIASGKYQLASDYKDPFRVNNQNSQENILAIPYDAINGGGLFLAVISFHAELKKKFQMQATPWGAGSAKAVPQFGSIYDPDDKRLDKTWIKGMQFAANGDTLRQQYDDVGEPLVFSRKMKNGIYTSEDAGWRIGKFEIEKGAQASLNNDFPIFRYSRVLMMKAEALLRTGKETEAADIVSQVRMRAFDDASKARVTAADLTKDSEYDYGYWENFEIVDEGNTDPVQYGGFLDELGREFAAEKFRRRDMIRFGVYTKKSWLSHRPNGDYRRVFPIPQDVVQSNPNLKQNPNY